MRRLGLSAFALGLAVVLSACQFSVSIDPFPDAVEVPANTDPSIPARQVTLAGNESVVFEVLLDSSVRAQQAIYFELDTNDVDLVLFSTGGGALASSSSSDVFLRGTTAVSAASVEDANVRAEAITIEKFCRGTCIARNANANVFYIQLINQAAASRTFNMYLFGAGYTDEYEFENDVADGAVVIPKGSTETGALERIGDSDWWRVTTGGTIDFLDSGIRPGMLEMRMQIYNTDGETPIPNQLYAPNQTNINIFAGEYIKVFELDDDAAGPSESSKYSLTLN